MAANGKTLANRLDANDHGVVHKHDQSLESGGSRSAAAKKADEALRRMFVGLVEFTGLPAPLHLRTSDRSAFPDPPVSLNRLLV